MSNFTSTIEYKFKVTNNLDKGDAQQKKFNFYLGLPYSKRKYRYMQVVNFATNKEGQHLFNVILGHSESSVAAMSDDILRNGSSTCKPAVTKVMRITYASVNVGQVSFLCNASNKEIFEGADWTGISGEYMKVKSFRTNGNDEVIGLIFDAADRYIVSARKNDGTNMVAKPETPADEVKVPQPDKLVLDVDSSEYARCVKENAELNIRIKSLTEENGFLKKDIEARENDIELLSTENADLHNLLKKEGSKPDETQKTFKDKFIDKIVDGFRAKLEELPDDELLMKGSIVHYDIWY